MTRNLLLAAALTFTLPTSLAFADENPERLFKAKCASCHSADGKGEHSATASGQSKKMKVGDITTAAWKKEFTEAKILETMEKGFTREKNGVKQEMKPVKLTPEQAKALAGYVLGLK